MGTPFLDLAC